MGFVAPIIGVAAAVGGALSSSASASRQNEANLMQIEANNREAKIRFMDLALQQQSLRDDYAISSQQRIADLAASMSKLGIQRENLSSQSSGIAAQESSGQSAINTQSSADSVRRVNQYQNALAQAAADRGINIQGVNYEQLEKDVVTNRAALFSALSPQYADMYRNDETSNLLDLFDRLRQTEGDNLVGLDYAKQQGDLQQQAGEIALKAQTSNDAYKQSAQQISLNANSSIAQNANKSNRDVLPLLESLAANATQIEQIGAYKNLVGSENSNNAQRANIDSATTTKNAQVKSTNKDSSLLQSFGNVANAVIPLFSLFQQQQQPPVYTFDTPLTSNILFDPNGKYIS